MSITETSPAADVFAHHGIVADVSWCNVSGVVTVNGREYRITATSSRATLHACNSAPGLSDGFEVARTYAAPFYSIPLLLDRAGASA